MSVLRDGARKGGVPLSLLLMLLQYLYIRVHSPKLGEESHLRHAGPGHTRCHSLLVSLHPSNIYVCAVASAGNMPQLVVRAEPRIAAVGCSPTLGDTQSLGLPCGRVHLPPHVPRQSGLLLTMATSGKPHKHERHPHWSNRACQALYGPPSSFPSPFSIPRKHFGQCMTGEGRSPLCKVPLRYPGQQLAANRW